MSGAMMQQVQPERVFGRYALFDEIAAGGMATVHLGRLIGPVGFSKTVAIKRLHPHLARDPEFVSMFLDEARLAARIQHPNVVATLDVVALEGEVFLVLDYVQGESLSRLLKALRADNQRADPRIISSVLVNALHGLHAAHEATNEHAHPLGIVHRDVSPQNLLVGIDGVARVLDFGVAKASGRLQSTRDGQLKGKLAYMAPEQVRGEPVDRRTDIYSAAVVLWEGLTGRRLIQTSNEAQVLADVLGGGFPPPSSIAPHLPKKIDGIVMKGLASNPNDRFNTARQMGVDLERALGVASPLLVGEWVQAIAKQALASRAARVREMESTSAVHMVPASNVATASAPPPPTHGLHEQTGSGISYVTSPSLITSPSQVSQPSAASSPSAVSSPSVVSVPSGVSAPSGVSSPSAVSAAGVPAPASGVPAFAPEPGAAPWAATAPPAPSHISTTPPAGGANKSPAKLVAIVVAVTALITLIGLAALLSLRDRPGEEPRAGAAGEAAPPATSIQAAVPADPPVATAVPVAEEPADPPTEATAEPVAKVEPPPAKPTTKPSSKSTATAKTTKTKPRGKPKETKPGPKTKPAGNCDSPFFIDKNGIKHVRPECM